MPAAVNPVKQRISCVMSFVRQGIPRHNIERKRHEVAAVRGMVDNAHAGDLVILLIHERRREVLDYSEYRRQG